MNSLFNDLQGFDKIHHDAVHAMQIILVITARALLCHTCKSGRSHSEARFFVRESSPSLMSS
eukprot:UN22630